MFNSDSTATQFQSHTAANFSLSEMAARWWTMAAVFLLLGFVAAVVFLVARRKSLAGMGWKLWLKAVFFHFPDRTQSLWPNVIIGVLLSAGTALAITPCFQWVFQSQVPCCSPEVSLEVTNFIFAAIVAAIALWTFSQTKLIEENQGLELIGFSEFITRITTELVELNENYRSAKAARYDHHRVLILTTNPVFGSLSFPDSKRTLSYMQALEGLAHSIRYRPGLQFEIICASDAALDEFHTGFYTSASGNEPTESEIKLAQAATESTKEFLDGLVRRSDQNIMLIRARDVPTIQFAVIGNTVFDFILDTRHGNTNVQRMTRTEDRSVALRFVQFFEAMKKIIDPSASEQIHVEQQDETPTNAGESEPAFAPTEADPLREIVTDLAQAANLDEPVRP